MSPTNPTNSEIRAFIGLELPHQARLDIAEVQSNLKAAGLKLRWVKPQNIHLTLKFLGDVEREKIADICDILKTVACRHPFFNLQPSGLGCFPGLKNPRVLWAGISGELDILRALHADMEKALIPCGFLAEKRSFRGHLTIGRIKNRLNHRKMVEALRTHSGFRSDRFKVKQVTVFESKLQPTGPIYTKLSELPLANA